MVKHVCDICKINEATNRFKVKKLEDVVEYSEFSAFPKSEWVDIDICTGCLIDICQAKRSECCNTKKDRIWVSNDVYERIRNNPKGVMFESIGKQPIIWKGSINDEK